MDDNRFKTSELWSEYRKTVSRRKGGRGYGINTSVSFFRIRAYLYIRSIFELPSIILLKLKNLIDRIIRKFEYSLSFVLLGKSDNHVKFCLDYGLRDYDPKLLEDFGNFTEDKILYSHNSLKSFDYLTRLDQETDLIKEFENNFRPWSYLCTMEDDNSFSLLAKNIKKRSFEARSDTHSWNILG